MPRRCFNILRLPLALGSLLGVLGFARPAAAAPPTAAETESFNGAAKVLEDKFYDLAEKRFADFAAKYPDSDRRASAVLYEAEAMYYEGKLNEAQALLNASFPRAGDEADRYLFWMAEIWFKRGKLSKAADDFLRTAREFPRSALRTEAFYRQALALAKTGDWRSVLEAVGPGNELFAGAARSKPDDEAVLRCRLLVAEAYLEIGNPEEAGRGLAELGSRKLPSDMAWRRQYLLCKIELGAGRFANALTLATNLTQTAASMAQPPLVAESVLLHGEALERLDRRREAVELYEHDLGLLPAEDRTPVRLKIARYYEESGPMDNSTNTTARLEALVQQSPNDEAADLARLTLGEIRLKTAFLESSAGSSAEGPLSAGATNALLQSLTNLTQAAETPRTNGWAGRAHADEGWCFWYLGRFGDAKAAFQRAVDRLPPSEERVVARFKLADAQFKLGELAAAQSNYRAVLVEQNSLGDMNAGLFDQAVYQLLRTSLLRGDPAAAESAARDLLQHFPGGALRDQNLLLLGGALVQARKPEEARALLSDFAQKFPASPLRAEAELAVAETFMDTGDFAGALRRYEEWKVRHPSDPLLPRAAYAEGLAADKAGFETNAFSMMTNFLAVYPGHPLWPLAKKWVADYYFNRQVFPEAERNYQELFLAANAPKNLADEARLMAGRSAYERQGIGEAATYFKQLLGLLEKESNSPPVLKAETSILLGDTLFQQYLQSTNRPDQDIRDVISAFSLATKAMPGSIYEAIALGRIGDCHFEYSALKESLSTNHLDPLNYTNALDAFQAALACPGADAAVRAEARVKIGLVFERRKQPREALKWYMKVVYPDDETEPADFVWVSRAGKEAARIYEELGQPESAVNIYARLAEKAPALKPVLDKRIDSLRQKKRL